MDPATYSHPIQGPTVFQTPLSIVVLTGDYVYKLKKNVKFDFADYGSLDRRKWLCEEEVRLNRVYAEDLYLDVVPLVRQGGRWRFGGAGEVVEYAVRMRQFDPSARMDRLAAVGGLNDELIRDLAVRVAEVHEAARVVEGPLALSYPERLEKAVEGILNGIPEGKFSQPRRESFLALLKRAKPLLTARAQAGRVRDVHGDLHQANIVLWKGALIPFDRIDFDERFRTIDLVADVAFLVMDLLVQGHPRAAFLFLNRYLEFTGDYSGLRPWPLFLTYRALVRGQVAHQTARATGLSERERVEQEALCHAYLEFAERMVQESRGRIVMMAGLPGSGKSTLAQQMAYSDGGICIRSDRERQRIHARHPEFDPYGSILDRLTYQRLRDEGRAVVEGGQTAILDATFVKAAYRQPILELARELSVPLQIIHCSAPLAVCRERVMARRASQRDISHADDEVILQKAMEFDPFSEAEKTLVVERFSS
jgi:hypothetical protein